MTFYLPLSSLIYLINQKVQNKGNAFPFHSIPSLPISLRYCCPYRASLSDFSKPGLPKIHVVFTSHSLPGIFELITARWNANFLTICPFLFHSVLSKTKHSLTESDTRHIPRTVKLNSKTEKEKEKKEKKHQ